MTISERLLRRWRTEALRQKELSEKDEDRITAILREYNSKIILCLTQELLDQHLLRK